jgi:regulator of protease activity HflC (stomatin/prohibitin superfamily)
MDLLISAGLGIIGLFVAWFVLAGIVYIGRFDVGILTRRMFGAPLSEGRVIACNGEVGVQAGVLMPGLYWRNPVVWRVDMVALTQIPIHKIGLVTAIDGEPIPVGRLLGDAVGCNNFQDAKAFIENGGCKGGQVGFLLPGTHRINNKAFKIDVVDSTIIESERIGVVLALDGLALPSSMLIAPKPESDDHNFFQNGQAFLNAKGYKGTQLDTLQPAEYYINSRLFEITSYPELDVPAGYVSVIRSNVGTVLSSSSKPGQVDAKPGFNQEVHEKDEVVLITNKEMRGILDKPLAAGKYNLNPVAYSEYAVPISAVTIDWASDVKSESSVVGLKSAEGESSTEFFRFNQLKLTTKDAFILYAEVRMVIRIRPEHAPFVIARFGSVENLIHQICHPLIDSSFRNKAGTMNALDFVQERTKLQAEALLKAREEFDKYYVEAQNLLISYIEVPEALRNTQTDKAIAEQQKEQFIMQASAQEENIKLKEKEARAAKQPDVIAAELSVVIEQTKAEAKRMTGDGERDYAKKVADGQAYANREIGASKADAYQAQVDALDKDKVLAIKVVETIADGKIKITPEVLVMGDGGQSGNLLTTYFATQLKPKDAPEEKGTPPKGVGAMSEDKKGT